MKVDTPKFFTATTFRELIADNSIDHAIIQSQTSIHCPVITPHYLMEVKVTGEYHGRISYMGVPTNDVDKMLILFHIEVQKHNPTRIRMALRGYGVLWIYRFHQVPIV